MQSASPQYVGVDWASGAWVAVSYADRDADPDVSVFDSIRAVWEAYGESSERIVVDVPIGLHGSGDVDDSPSREADEEISRTCDDIARDVVGDQYRSVFTAPARDAAELAADETTPYADVTARNEDLTGKGLSRQAANISPAITAVDSLLVNNGDPAVLVEGHPEVCVRAFNGESLTHSKHTAAGVDERLSAIEDVPEYTDSDWRTLARSLAEDAQSVALDDLLDALVLALTACADESELRRLPTDPPEDAQGLPMQMVYRSETELD
ncbi:DUF429 domain-containing protein [Halomicrobium salinisoli]|uniref:DUF429 domain-containing protein n=1 Tax=Halomicrobium salinisoli TaxID=2878391 RepID=UPI001CF01D63|nr:DUF429 domain-containing protein [Halomicrobium salinisoli]